MRKAAIILSIFVMSGLMSLAVEAYRLGPSATASSQDPIYLDRRISLLEQRFSIMESNVNRLQQQVMTTASTPVQPARSPEVELLRSELEILKSHLREVNCGVARLDERTLSAEGREALRRSSPTKDPCRQFPDAPIQLTPIR